MNWKQAFSIGVIAPGMWDGKGEPVAYLYNGVRLPKLPEWDRNTYPYAVFLVGNISGTVSLYILSAVEYAVNSRGVWSVTIPIGTPIATVAEGATRWSDFSELTYATEPYVGNIDWANFDVLNEDGTVFLAASDPIPVYE